MSRAASVMILSMLICIPLDGDEDQKEAKARATADGKDSGSRQLRRHIEWIEKSIENDRKLAENLGDDEVKQKFEQLEKGRRLLMAQLSAAAAGLEAGKGGLPGDLWLKSAEHRAAVELQELEFRYAAEMSEIKRDAAKYANPEVQAAAAEFQKIAAERVELRKRMAELAKQINQAEKDYGSARARFKLAVRQAEEGLPPP